jgi:hypothetical protein
MDAVRALFLLVAVSVLSCSGKGCGSPNVTDAGALSAAVSVPVIETPPPPDDEKPVYPITKDPPEPLAQRYCALFYERAETRRKACCPKTTFTPVLLTSECVRTLSAALRSKAVTVETTALDACEAQIAVEEKQCDWGGELPEQCKGLVKGTIAAGALCRSSLECVDGLQCRGLGTSRAGNCAPPSKVGERCADAPDTLASFVRQDVAATHPVCDGHCFLGACRALAPAGGECKSMLDCQKGTHCRANLCTDAPFPTAGQPCGGDACAAGLRCVAGTCTAIVRLGEACSSDDGCRSAFCEQGKCALSCDPIKRKGP